MATDKTVQFLLQSAALYSHQCPQLSAHLTTGLPRYTGKCLPSSISLSLCPHCSTPLTPHTASQRTLSARALRVKRRMAKVKGHEIPSLAATAKSRHYIIVHCRQCRRSHVINTEAPHTPHTPHTPHSTPSHTPHSTPSHTPHSTPSHTPHSTPSHTPHKSRRRSSTLKSLLAGSSLTQLTRAKPPKLADFLDTV